MLFSSWKVFRDTLFPKRNKHVVIYFNSYASPSKALDAWHQCLIEQGDIDPYLSHALVYRNHGEYVNIMHGATKPIKTISHHLKATIENSKKNYILNETSLLGRGMVVADGSRAEWYRVGINGFLADSGTYISSDFKDSNRFESIRAQKELEVKPWNPGSNHVLIALQVPNDASLRGANITQWAYSVASKIRRLSSVKIVLRTPQIYKEFDPYYLRKIKSIPNLSIQEGSFDNLFETIDKSIFTCTYSSGLGIDSILRGIPVVVESSASFVFELRTDLENALSGDFNMPNRDYLFEKLAWREFSLHDIRSGYVWRLLKSEFFLQ